MFPNGYSMPFIPPYGNMGVGAIAPRTGGLFSRLASLRSINWQGLLNNTSRTLGVINQAIPLVKQVGPMYNNMKSMLKVASLFKDETDPPKKNKNNSAIKSNNSTNNVKKNTSYNNNVNNSTNVNNTNSNNNEYSNTNININYDNSPNFFI